jgi:hypothetical protein
MYHVIFRILKWNISEISKSLMHFGDLLPIARERKPRGEAIDYNIDAS